MDSLFSHFVVAPNPDVVRQEADWRSSAGIEIAEFQKADQVVFSQWTLQKRSAHDVRHNGHDAQYCVAIALDTTSLSFSHDDKLLWSGPLQRGGAQITCPNVATSATFFDHADVLHAYIPASYIEETYEDCFGKGLPQSWALDDPRMYHDDQFWRLGMALLGHQQRYSTVDSSFLSGLGLSMVVRLVSARFGTAGQQQSDRISSLPSWRLKRVTDYIHGHLEQALTLSELAAVAGLTRMHFAAQFRKATGVRPHEYVCRVRVDRSRALLLRPEVTIIDVAASCGFRSQSHFTSVFRRFTGTTPHRWRVECSR